MSVMVMREKMAVVREERDVRQENEICEKMQRWRWSRKGWDITWESCSS